MVFLASKTCYWEQSWRLLRNRLWNMIWGVDHSTLQTKSSSFFIIRGNPVLTTGSSSLKPVLWKWHEQKFMCRNNISKLTLFKKVRLITPKLQVRLITPPDARLFCCWFMVHVCFVLLLGRCRCRAWTFGPVHFSKK